MPAAHDTPAPPLIRPAAVRPSHARRTRGARRRDRDDSHRHAALAVQRSLDRRDNGGSFGH